MNNKLKPALIGGVVLGILSVIPFVSVVNLCCCLWAILGGMLASYLYIKNSPTPATAADGAVLGAIAGVVGAAIELIIGIPINYAMGPTMRNLMIRILENADPRQAEVIRRQLEAGGGDSIAAHISQGLISAVLLFVFALIGGLLGVVIFEKRKGGAPPPPPINVGGPVGGGPGGYAA